MEYVIYPSVLFLLSLLLTWVVRFYALKYSIIDNPNARSSHEIPTPRGGGLAIVLSFLLLLFALFVTDRISSSLFSALVISGGAVAGVGFVDDCISLSSKLRFAVHILAALCGLYLLKAWEITLPGLSWTPGWVSIPILCFFLVWLLNLYNFMDGIDGIAGVETIFTALGMGGIICFTTGGTDWTVILVGLAASTAGFLVWNWPPAKIFMGDSASGFLGITFGILMIASMKEFSIGPWPWLILMAVFLVDSSYTLLVRMLSGQKWYAAHRSHAYQNASRKYASHKKVTLAVVMINVFWLLPHAFLVMLFPDYSIPVTLVATSPLLALAVWLGAGHEH